MNLVNKEHCFQIFDPAFGSSVIAGFTKNTLSGDMPQDALRAVSFLGAGPAVSYLKQVHSSRVHDIQDTGVYEGDGLFTDQKQHLLVVRTADCLPLFFSSTKLGVIGMVHMGWRSAKEGILRNIPYELSTFTVIAGAGMRSCCYQVGEEFFSYGRIGAYLSRHNGKLYFDPISFARQTLFDQGLEAERFKDCSICSVCSGEKFFSHRRDASLERTLSFIVKT